MNKIRYVKTGFLSSTSALGNHGIPAMVFQELEDRGEIQTYAPAYHPGVPPHVNLLLAMGESGAGVR